MTPNEHHELTEQFAASSTEQVETAVNCRAASDMDGVVYSLGMAQALANLGQIHALLVMIRPRGAGTLVIHERPSQP